MKPYDLLDRTRFMAMVDQRPGLGPDGDCHFWRGAKAESGTGVLTARTGKQTVNFKAHRVAHWLHYGHMPEDLFCIHACGETACVNPRHLYLSDRKKGVGPARIMRAVNMGPGHGPAGECWEFTGAREPKMGYGIFCDDTGSTMAAHRYMFAVVNGSIPKGAMVLHRCDNGPCCNPAHLYLGDHTGNMRDRAERGRTAHARGYAKLTEDQARSIKADLRPASAIAAEFKVSPTTVRLIKRGLRWVGLPARP